MRHSFQSFGRRVCGASLSTKSFDLALRDVMEADRLLWQSVLELKCQQIIFSGVALGRKGIYSQKLPSIRSYPGSIYIVWIPRPNGIQAFGVQVESGF
jgi:hypothetical protein